MHLLFPFSLCLLLGLSDAGIDGGEEVRQNLVLNGLNKDYNWTDMCTNGTRQSPINLNTANATCHNLTSNIRFRNFDQQGNVTVKNNGHTGVIKGFDKWNKRPKVVRTDLRLTYNLEQIHFHWDMDNHGSEHMIDGKQSTAEMHMVFVLGNLTLDEAKGKIKGLVVVGIFLDVIPGAKLGIYEDLIKIDNTTDKFFMDTDFDMSTKIPGRMAEHFIYDGSLTTPECYENVYWIVYKKPMGMAKEELAAMREMRDAEHNKIEHNNRDTQGVHERHVDLHSPHCKK